MDGTIVGRSRPEMANRHRHVDLRSGHRGDDARRWNIRLVCYGRGNRGRNGAAVSDVDRRGG